jgi:hypothetical protein
VKIPGWKAGQKPLTLSFLLLCSVHGANLNAFEEKTCEGVVSEPTGEAPAANISDKVSFERVYREVECLLRAASKAGAVWLNTASLLSQSRQQADEENWLEAGSLLQSAKLQAEAAIAQAAHEAEAWKRRVVGYR